MAIELTDDDKRNGWNLKALKAYHEEREQAEGKALDASFDRMFCRNQRPRWTNSKYSPLHWRG